MAVTATFVADFTNFLAQAKAAEGSLETLAAAAGVTSASVDRAAKAFSGESIIASASRATQAVEAIGGASKLTESEMSRVNRTLTEALAKMELMGIQAPANMRQLAEETKKVPPALEASAVAANGFKVALAGISAFLGPAAIIGSVIGLGKAAMDSADQLVKLSDKTGISIDGLQTLQYVADQSGNTLEQVTSAVSKMQQKLAGGDSSAAAAYQKLHLNMKELIDLQPDQAVHKIADAFQNVINPAERAQLAVAIFGKTGAEILPTLLNDMQKIRDEAPKMSDSAQRGLDAFGDMISRIWLTIKNVVGTVLAYVFDGLNLMTSSMSRAFGAMSAALSGNFKEAANIIGGLSDVALPKLNSSVKVTGDVVEDASESTKKLGSSSSNTASKQYELTKYINDTNDAVKRSVAEHEKAIASHDKFASTIKSLGTNYVMYKAAIDDVGESLHNLPSESIVDTAKATAAATAETEKWKRENLQTIPVIHGMADAATESAKKVFTMSSIFADIPKSIVAAIQGGGSIIGAAGASIGTNLMAKFNEHFGPAIKAALPFGIGEAVTALLPTLGAMFGPVAEKIAGFFKSIFGGPSQDELRGRQAVADFEKQLASLLNQTQLNEAGNDAWKKTVIAIRDAYLAAGLSEQDALADAERLWKSSKDGGGASQKVIDEITAKMKGLGDQTKTTGDKSETGFAAVKKAADDVSAAVGGVLSTVEGINSFGWFG